MKTVGLARHQAARDRPEDAIAEASSALTVADAIPGARQAFELEIGMWRTQIADREQHAAPLDRLRDLGIHHDVASLIGEIDELAPRMETPGDLAHLAIVEFAAGRVDSAHRRLGEAMAEYGKRGDLIGESRCWNNLASFFAQDGQWTEALAASVKALRLRRRAGDPPGEVVCLSNIALYHLFAGEFAEASRVAEECIRIHGNQPPNTPFALAWWARAMSVMALSRFDDFEELSAQAAGILAQIGGVTGELQRDLEEAVRAMRAAAAARQPEISAALSAAMERSARLAGNGKVEQSIDVLTALLEAPDLEALAEATVRGELGNRLCTAGRAAEGEHEYDRAADLYEVAGRPGMACFSKVAAARAMRLQQHWDRAAERLTEMLGQELHPKVRAIALVRLATVLRERADATEEPPDSDRLVELFKEAGELVGAETAVRGRAWYMVGQLMAERGDIEKSQGALRAARALLVPSNSPLLDEITKLEVSIDAFSGSRAADDEP